MELRINKDAVSHIKIYDFYKTDYIWCDKKPIKFLGIFNDGEYREGYWRRGEQSHWNWCMDEEYLNDYVVEEGVLIEKPRIKIFTGEHVIKHKYFDSLEAAQKYCKGKFPNVTVIFKD